MDLDLNNLFGAREVLSEILGPRWGRRAYHAGVFLGFLALVAISIGTLWHFGKSGVQGVVGLFVNEKPPAASADADPLRQKQLLPPQRPLHADTPAWASMACKEAEERQLEERASP